VASSRGVADADDGIPADREESGYGGQRTNSSAATIFPPPPPRNIRVEPCTNLHGELESLRPITDSEVHCISGLFQSSVPWRSRLARPDRATLEAFCFNFCTSNYQLDYTKVVPLYTSSHFVITILISYSLDQALSGSKFEQTNHSQSVFRLGLD
jgi:hypothetical protein